MSRLIAALATLGFFTAGTAVAANLTVSQYGSTGSVASNNGAASCAQVGLTTGAANDSVVKFPGNGKVGLTIYNPAPTALQLCTGFPAVPAAGLNGFSATVTCTLYTPTATIKAPGVNFAFTQRVIDANSAVGTTTVTIPANAPLGAGCSAVVDVTQVRSGK